MASYASNSHAKLHSRGHSASSITTPAPIYGAEANSYAGRPVGVRNPSWEEYGHDEWPRSTTPQPSASFKIRPYLRKMSLKEDGKIDLSRPAAENESLTGLGFHDNVSASRSATDIHSSYVSAGRARHSRTTSNNSQFSTASRPSAPYNPHHPLRHTPRPYTPPITKSYTTTSVMASDDVLPDEHSGDVTPTTEEEIRFKQRIFDATKKRADSGASLPPAPLRHQASTSLTKLSAQNASQSSFNTVTTITTAPHLPHTVRRSRSRGDTLLREQLSETPTSPSSRTSFDKAISGFLRSTKSAESLDPAVQRALEIRAARQAYAEREQAKDQKAHAEEAKRQRKQSIREERQRRKSDAVAEKEGRRLLHQDKEIVSSGGRKRAGTASSSGKSSTHTYEREKERLPSEKDSSSILLSKRYADTLPAHAEALPTYAAAPLPSAGATRTGSLGLAAAERRSGRGRWASFVAWFRTRLLRVSRGVRVGK